MADETSLLLTENTQDGSNLPPDQILKIVDLKLWIFSGHSGYDRYRPSGN